MENGKSESVKKYTMSFIALALAMVIPVLAFAAVTMMTKPQFSETFLGELSEKYDRLRSVDGEKVVLIGGSSLAFGIDSDAMEAVIGRPVVNFGLYATLGTKVMMDLSKSGLSRGDVVVICPEMDTQTLSLYYNSEAMWQACDSDMSLLLHIGKDNIGDMAGGFWGYAASKIRYANSGGLDVTGVYAKSSFDEYGDIVYERPYNQMTLGFDPNKYITLSGEIFDGDFIDYVNDYVAWAHRHGVDVYFSFPPMNEDAVLTTDEEEIHAFYQFLHDNLDCEVISEVGDYILDAGYFYDSNFHLNDAGVPIRSMQLCEDIMRAIGKTDAVEIVYPDIPDVPVVDDEQKPVTETDFTETAADAFIVEDFGEGVVISGIADAGKSLDTIVIPREIGGKRVLALGASAFADADAMKTLVIFDNVVQIYDGFLSGAAAIENVYIYNTDCNSVAIGAELLSGLGTPPTILVPYESYGSYVSDYFWGIYAGRLSVIDPPQ